METIIELNEKKRNEAAKLERMNQRAHAANVAFEDAERDLEGVERRVKEEEEEALLNERQISLTGSEKAIRDAAAKVTAAKRDLASARAIVTKQSAICTAIESQIQARRHEAFAEDLAPAKARLVSDIAALIKSASAVNEIGHRHGTGTHVLGEELFPAANPADRLQDYLFRGGLASLVNYALAIRQHLYSYERVPDWGKKYVA